MKDTQIKIIGAARVLLFVCFLTWVNVASGQVDRSKLLGAYVYNFAKLSSSSVKKDQGTYNIVLVSKDAQVISEFQNMAEEKTLEGKKINVSVMTTDKFNTKGVCLVFVTKDLNQRYARIFRNTKETDILLVSEEYSNKLNILLNLYQASDGNVLFEMNRANIYEREITMDDEVLLMGGTQVDLQDLYMNSKKELSRQVSKSEKELKELNRNIEIAKDLLEVRSKKIKSQEGIIDHLNEEKEELAKNIEELNTVLEEQHEKFDKRSRLFKNIYDGLMTAQDRIEDQNSKIQEGDKTLATLNEQLRAMDYELDNRALDLIRKETKIIRQRKTLLILIGVAIVVGLLLILLFIIYRQKKKQNVLLKSQKEEILKYNNELRLSRDEVINVNKELNISLDEIKKMQDQMIESEKMASLGILAAGVSHEINNPLNYIKGGSVGIRDHIKRKNISGSEWKLFLDAIDTGVERAANIVSELNQLGGSEITAMIQTDLIEMIEQSIDQVRSLGSGQVEITSSYQVRPVILIANPTKLRKAIFNILENANEAISGKGQISVEVTISDGKALLRIEDNGCGMSTEQLARIKEPFFTTRDPGQGVGLGLSTTWSIVRAHKGWIRIESQEGKGTVVTMLLPIIQRSDE